MVAVVVVVVVEVVVVVVMEVVVVVVAVVIKKFCVTLVTSHIPDIPHILLGAKTGAELSFSLYF